MAHESSTLPGSRPLKAGAPAPNAPPTGARPTPTTPPVARPGLTAAPTARPTPTAVPIGRHAQPSAWVDAWVSAIGTPRLETFQKLAANPRASTERAYLWLAGAALVGWGVPAAASLTRGGLPGWTLALAALGLAALTIAWFSLAQAAAHYVAEQIGAPAAFARLAYPAAAFCAPLIIVAGLLLAGPGPMRVLLLPLLGYGFFLEVLAIRAAHRLAWVPALLAAAPGTLLMLVPLAAVAGLALQLL